MRSAMPWIFPLAAAKPGSFAERPGCCAGGECPFWHAYLSQCALSPRLVFRLRLTDADGFWMVDLHTPDLVWFIVVLSAWRAFVGRYVAHLHTFVIPHLLPMVRLLDKGTFMFDVA